MAKPNPNVRGRAGKVRFANVAEDEFFVKATAMGWRTFRRGWPDFWCIKDGKMICVEVKPRGSKALKREQRWVLEMLASYGVRCYRWTPDEGFERIIVKRSRRLQFLKLASRP